MRKYSDIAAFHNVIGKVNMKPLSNTNYVKAIQLKRSVKKSMEDLTDMQENVYTDHKLEQNFDGSFQVKPGEIEKVNNVNRAMSEIMAGEVEITGDRFLTFEGFEQIRQANNLTIGEEDILIDWLVTEQP